MGCTNIVKRGLSGIIRQSESNENKNKLHRRRTAQPNQRHRMIQKIRDVKMRQEERLRDNLRDLSNFEEDSDKKTYQLKIDANGDIINYDYPGA